MKLLAIEVENFRAYETPFRVSIDDLTALIGRNDVGKSTILEALEIFFNNQVVKLDSGDACVHSGRAEVRIACTFGELPPRLVVDAAADTSLAGEFLTNADGYLEVHKVFNCGLKTPKEAVYAKAIHPGATGYSDLLSLKNSDLKKRAKDLEVDLSGIDNRSNPEIRRAIWDSCSELEHVESFVPLDSQDGKKIWDALKPLLPLFALFQADRPSRDDDSEVQDPMKWAVAQAIAEVSDQLELIKQAVELRATSVADRTLQKLSQMDATLAGELSPRFKAEPKWDSIFKISLTGDNEIPVNKRGSGVRRLILLNFFRAEAERRLSEMEARGIIYAIEEPETSQHPRNQHAIIQALRDLAAAEGTQVLLTTHVPGLAGLLPVDSLRFIDSDGLGERRVRAGSDQVYEQIAAELGVIPDNRVAVFVCVEGPHDVTFLRAISKALASEDPEIVDLESDPRVAILPLGGSTLRDWVQDRYLRELRRPEFHLYDRDDSHPPKYQAQCDAVNARGDGSSARLTDRRELENYLHPSAVEAEFQISVTFGPTDDVPVLVAAELHRRSETTTPWHELAPEKRKKKISRAKQRLNNGATRYMTPELIADTDPGGEIRTWLAGIANHFPFESGPSMAAEAIVERRA
jgi:putative ATP-dependent endonuclease of OLD family